ncbi:MAG: hypothetical protein AAF225_10095 [Pseudomonadota bacterium]
MEIAWRPTIGDPTVTGWLAVCLYAAVSSVALTLAAACRPPIFQRPELRFWAFLALSFAALSVNKQLDLQSLMTELGRLLAKEHGWYNTRRYVQGAFIVGVGASALLGLLTVVALSLRAPWPNRIAQLGTALVIAFVAIRASSFHGMDLFISYEPIPHLRMNAVLELGGITLVLLGSVWRLIDALGRVRSRQHWDFEAS